MRVTDLPPDVWVHVPLGQRDMQRVAVTCRALREAMRRVRCVRGLHLRQSHVDAALDLWAPHIRKLLVSGSMRRGIISRQWPSPLPPLPACVCLRDLELRHVYLPARRGFWAEVFRACPVLERVRVTGDYVLRSYATDVHHATDLVELGAPRLRELDIEGGWLVMYPAPSPTEFHDIVQAAERAYTLPPVASDTLRTYRAACKQAPVGVDAPLHSLVIEEPHQAPLIAARMGPRTYASTAELTWKVGWPVLDPGLVARFGALRSLDLVVSAVASAERVSAACTSLAALPATLTRLRLAFDMWQMRAMDSVVQWGRPLAHMHALRDLEVRMLFAPCTVAELLSGWLGAPALRFATARFDEAPSDGFEARLARLQEDGVASDDELVQEIHERWDAASEPVATAGLHAWLAANPLARVRVRCLPYFRSPHPRVTTRAGWD